MILSDGAQRTYAGNLLMTVRDIQKSQIRGQNTEDDTV
jgi:hypothetical protein